MTITRINGVRVMLISRPLVPAITSSGASGDGYYVACKPIALSSFVYIH